MFPIFVVILLVIVNRRKTFIEIKLLNCNFLIYFQHLHEVLSRRPTASHIGNLKIRRSTTNIDLMILPLR